MTDTASQLKQIWEKLDASAPKIDQIDWSIYNRILENTDFTNCKDTQAVMNLFYQQLWVHVIFPLEDERHLYQRENGRFILEADTNRRKAEALQAEVESLREKLQEEGLDEA